MTVKRTTEIPQGVPKEIRKVLAVAKSQGWSFSHQGAHPKAWPPDGISRPVAIPTSPRKHGHAFDNFVGEMKRAGLTWPA